jgi:hypothetical protein
MHPRVIKATNPASATYRALAAVAIPAKPPERMAAVAESAATTRYREATRGNNSV